MRHIILYGSGQELIEFHYHRPSGGQMVKRHAFEGIIPNMQRRYRESDSGMIREELAKYLSSRPCLSCQGARLRVEARHVFIDNKIYLKLLPIQSRMLMIFKNLRMTGYKGEIAAKINKEIVERLGFLVNVGLDYLSLARSAETLSGAKHNAFV